MQKRLFIQYKQVFTILNLKIPSVRTLTLLKPQILAHFEGGRCSVDLSYPISSGGCWSFKEGKLIFGQHHKNVPFIYT